MSLGFAVAVVTREGRVLGYSAPLDMTKEELFNELKLGYQAFIIVERIIKQFGYKAPKHISISDGEYEVTVFNRGAKLVISVLENETIPSRTGPLGQLAET